MQLGLGTAAIGRPHYINIRSEANTTDFDLAEFKSHGKAILDAAYAQGIRYFDTAPGYGMAESLLLEWVGEKNDSEIEVATKWGYTYVANFDANAAQHEIKEHSLAKLNEQWSASEALFPNLSTYQIHSATFASGVLENEAVLNRLGALKAEHGLKMGLSASGPQQAEIVEKAMEIQIDGQALFEVFQVTYNVFEQSMEALISATRDSNTRWVIKEAMANGRVFPNSQFPEYAPTYAYLELLARKYNVTIDAIALRYCQDSLNPFKVLSGAAVQAHLSQNLKMNEFTLTSLELATLKKCRVERESYWEERSQLPWN